jgi:hypothetical protein
MYRFHIQPKVETFVCKYKTLKLIRLYCPRGMFTFLFFPQIKKFKRTQTLTIRKHTSPSTVFHYSPFTPSSFLFPIKSLPLNRLQLSCSKSLSWRHSNCITHNLIFVLLETTKEVLAKILVAILNTTRNMIFGNDFFR